MKKISAALISWNEVQTIDLCLKSLAGFADEVMLIDTGSFDGTVVKACKTIEEFGINGKVIRMQAKSLGEARFAAMENCSYDWILLSDGNMVYGDHVKEEFKRVQTEGRMGAMASLNLMGDYEHCFTPLPMNALHLTLFPKESVVWSDLEDRPQIKGPRKGAMRRMKSWAVNLSRVRPAWRCWYRGEPFDPRFTETHRWKTESNRQLHWAEKRAFTSLVNYVKTVEGLSFEDVQRVAPQWFLGMLQRHAKKLSEETQELLPSVIRKEQKSPRYKVVYDEEEISGRRPEL